MCERRHQVMYDRIDGIFKNFVDNNRPLFIKMNYTGVIDVRQIHKDGKLYATNMLDGPFNVAHIGLTDYGEGNLIAFLDKDFDKIYHYYDVN